jgi:hypothetical protein
MSKPTFAYGMMNKHAGGHVCGGALTPRCRGEAEDPQTVSWFAA